MNTGNPQKQKQVMFAINTFVLVFLMTFITRVVKAYIGLSFPDQPELSVNNLITLPSIYGMVAALLIGPLALKFKKSTLTSITMCGMILHCVIFYLVGALDLPFWWLQLASLFGGAAIGMYIPLLNSIISDHFPADKRANCIAQYNVWINIGGVVITYAAGWLAAGNNGANWENAYLLGIASVIGLVVFNVLAKKNDIDTPSIVVAPVEESAVEVKKPGIKDIPLKVLGWVVLMGCVHALFYVTQNAFNANVSSYIITEYNLGTSVEAGTATSLVRFALIPFTALYPFFKKILKGWMIPVGYLTMAVGLFIMMTTKSLFGAYACAIFCGMSTALVHSEFYATASRYVPLALVPISMSVVSCLVNTGSGFSSYVLQFFAGLLGGTMADRFMVGMVISIVIAIAAVFMYVVKKPAFVDEE